MLTPANKWEAKGERACDGHFECGLDCLPATAFGDASRAFLLRRGLTRTAWRGCSLTLPAETGTLCSSRTGAKASTEWTASPTSSSAVNDLMLE